MYYGAEGAVRPAVRQKESPLPPAGNMEPEPTSVLTGHLSKGAETTAYLCPNDFCTHGIGFILKLLDLLSEIRNCRPRLHKGCREA
jgi:hypothetical protein